MIHEASAATGDLGLAAAFRSVARSSAGLQPASGRSRSRALHPSQSHRSRDEARESSRLDSCMAQAPPLRRILSVEDDPDIQMLAQFALTSLGGFEVRLAGSGAQALARI